jgi:hypothetical protein
LIAASGLLALWIGLLFLFRDFAESALLPTPGFAEAFTLIFSPASNSLLSLPSVIFLVVSEPLTLPVLIVLWAFPLAACLRRNRAASPSMSGWAFLDPPPQRPALPRRVPCRSGLAVKAGLIGGVVFCVLLLVVRVLWQLGVPEATREADEVKLAFFFGQVALATLMQAGVAAVVAGWVRRLGGIHGLFAAFIAGLVMSVGILGLNLLFGGTIDLGFAWTVFHMALTGGALLALPSMLGASVLEGWVRRLRWRDGKEGAA